MVYTQEGCFLDDKIDFVNQKNSTWVVSQNKLTLLF